MSAEHQPLTTIFSKRPRPGAVKTRLCPPLSHDQAASLALAMLDDAVDMHLRASSYATHLAVSPAESVDWFRERYTGRVPVSAQVGEGLGERMARWFEARYPEHRSVVIVGSDCPLLDAATVVEAHGRLAVGADVVLAPDGGGGYSLVGLSRPAPALFTQIRMSTASMFDETVHLARSTGLVVEVFPEHRDVDVIEDVLRLDRELRDPTLGDHVRGGPDFPASTSAWLRDNAPIDHER